MARTHLLVNPKLDFSVHAKGSKEVKMAFRRVGSYVNEQQPATLLSSFIKTIKVS